MGGIYQDLAHLFPVCLTRRGCDYVELSECLEYLLPVFASIGPVDPRMSQKERRKHVFRLACRCSLVYSLLGEGADPRGQACLLSLLSQVHRVVRTYVRTPVDVAFYAA